MIVLWLKFGADISATKLSYTIGYGDFDCMLNSHIIRNIFIRWKFLSFFAMIKERKREKNPLSSINSNEMLFLFCLWINFINIYSNLTTLFRFVSCLINKSNGWSYEIESHLLLCWIQLNSGKNFSFLSSHHWYWMRIPMSFRWRNFSSISINWYLWHFWPFLSHNSHYA